MGLFSFFSRTPEPVKAPLKFRNTLSGEVEPLIPLSEGEIKMYNCGPTVYDRQHIGNMRPYVFADVLRRTLEHWGYRVKQVINITDVGHLVSDADEGEDKMEKSAKARGLSAQEIAREITQLFFDDLDALGVERLKIMWPRATEFINEQIALVKALMEKGYAYKISDGIYFDTARFPAYGKLGGIALAGQKAGARVEENREKKSPHDFALWKFSKPGEKREQEWESPWGVGFPGWHIECTAMIFKLLGRQIDIHTGGVDHIPVHHNNEIAQAEAVSGRQYVRTWMHNEFITIEGKKISKSLGNTIYLSQLADRGFSPLALRYLYLTAHYRSPVNFTWDAIEAANNALMRLWRIFFDELSAAPQGGAADPAFIRDLEEALANDLDTPHAVARIWELVKEDAISPASKKASLLVADAMLGLGLSAERPSMKIDVLVEKDIPDDIRALVRQREEARQSKDFTKADDFRGKLNERGYEVKDTPNGPALTRKN